MSSGIRLTIVVIRDAMRLTPRLMFRNGVATPQSCGREELGASGIGLMVESN